MLIDFNEFFIMFLLGFFPDKICLIKNKHVKPTKTLKKFGPAQFAIFNDVPKYSCVYTTAIL